MDIIIDFFRQNVSPEQRDLAAFVQKRGGEEAILEDGMLLGSLYRERTATVSSSASSNGSRGRAKVLRRESTMDLRAAQADLLDDPEIAIANNYETFERKFRMQQSELANEMRRIIHHQGDRVISAVTAGPHDRIIDPVSDATTKGHFLH